MGNGNLPLLHYSSLFGKQSVLVLDKNIIHTILAAPQCSSKRKEPRFMKKFKFLSSRIGDGLVTLEGENWMRHRRIIQPSFNTGLLRDRLAEVVPPFANSLVTYWKSLDGKEIDVSSHMSAVTLDVVGIVLFAHKFNAVQALREEEENVDSFADALGQAFHAPPLTVALIVLGGMQYEPILRPRARDQKRALNDAVDKVLLNAKRQRDVETSDESNNKSLLHLLFEAQDPATQQENGSSPNSMMNRKKLSWQELRDETKTFLMAGHETTSTWLYWVLYALAKHPDVQERLYEELEELDVRRRPSVVDEMESLEYLNAVLKEALRLYAPVGMIPRYNTYHETFAGYDIPPNTRLTLSIFLLHRHPAYWDDPESFLPERWINVSPEETERRKFAFMPFSAGVSDLLGWKHG